MRKGDFQHKTPLLPPIPLQMSSSNSNEDLDSTSIIFVKDSPSKNTRSPSSAGQKKNAPQLKAVSKGKTKAKSTLPTAAKKTILTKNHTLPTSKLYC
jgi:hypothetical protein